MANVDPIQDGDGSQAATASAFRVGNFGPSPTPRLETNVAAPLDVRSGPSQASYLAAQLQQSLESMRYPMMTAERIAGMKQAQQMGDKGTAAAVSGNVDPALMQKDQNYNAAVTRVIAQRHGLQAVNAWQQYIADPKNNAASMTSQQLLQAHDDFMRKALGGLESNPNAATVLAPLIQHSANETLGRFHLYKQNENFQDGLTTAVGVASAAVQHGGPFDYQGQLSTLTTLAGGNRSVAKAQLDKGLIQQALADHNPALLGLIQAAPGQSGPAPATALAISDARDSINRYTAEQASQGIQQRQYGILSQWDNSLTSKTPISQAAINEAVANKDITPEAGLMYLQKSNDLREHMAATTAANTATNAGAPLYTLAGQQIPGAKPGKVYTQEILQKSFDANIDRLPPNQRINAAVRGTQQHGFVYTPLASTANNEPLNTEQGVKDVTGLYNGLNSVDASVTGKYFSPKRLAEVRQILQMKQAGMSDADIATWTQKHGDPQTPEAVGIKAASINSALANAGWTVSGPRAHWYTPGTSSNVPVLSGIANPGQLTARVKTRAGFLAQSGLCTPDVCVSEAARQIKDESYTIDVGNGHSLVIPMTKSDPPPGLSQPALQDFFDNHAVQIANADGWHGDKSELRLIPNTVQPGTYTLMDATGRAVSRDTFTLAGIVGAYQKSAYGRIQAQQQTAAARAVKGEQAAQAEAAQAALLR